MTGRAERPFYVIGHNPNSIPAVSAALAAGANAIEPDVNVYEERPDVLCISESGILDRSKGGGAGAPSLATYLDQLREIANEDPRLALVVFDCKPRVASSPALGMALRTEVRNRLTRDSGINVIFSVSSLSRMQMFERIAATMGEREGLMVDQEGDPAAVSAAFDALQVTNRCYGNGTIGFLDLFLGGRTLKSMVAACALRHPAGKLRFIEAWTVNRPSRMRQHIRAGVDGVITDHPERLVAILGEPEFTSIVRYAARADDPLTSPRLANGEGASPGIA